MTNNQNNTEDLGEKIVKELKSIFDPEIPVDIYELGLIYDVFVNEDNEVKILMTLTTPNCPVAESLPQEVEEKIKSLDEVKTAEVEITFDPPWTKDLIKREIIPFEIIASLSASNITMLLLKEELSQTLL